MRFLGRVVLVLLIVFPFSASALTVAELTAQATALLQQVQALQAKLSGGTTSTTATATGTAGYCPGIGRSLKTGSTGDDVSRLQRFLAQDPVIYPEGTVSAYFGALTEAAVKRWQTKFNIVSSGTPTTTGYGAVGPRTAAAIAIVCSGGAYNGVSGVVSPAAADAAVGGFIKVTPIQGVAPLTVSIEATVNTTKSCTTTVYVLEFGDQSTPQLLPSSAGACDQQVYVLSHTYTSGGTFTTTLSAGGHKTTASVQVTGTTQTQIQQKVASVSITDSAFTPRILTVEPGTKITWTNAGAMTHNVTADNNSFRSNTLSPGATYSQTFTLVGNYPYHCSLHGGVGGVGMSGSVVVAAATTNTGNTNTGTTTPNTGSTNTQTTYGTTVVSSPETASYGRLAVTPGISGNALTAQVQFDLPGCPQFALDWGDDTALVTSSTTQCAANMTLTHTYADSGSYTISLDRSARTDRAPVIIWGN